MKRQIVNIVNFIRGSEPRGDTDLLEPVREQLRLADKHRLKTTFLLQYDALINPLFTELVLPARSENLEVGIWFEIVQALAEQAGIPWKGRYSWDWHSNCAFPCGYTLSQRERLADVFMEDFYAIAGEYPASVGSWAPDAYTINLLQEKYGVDAVCLCKDQWGTDGYNLWGGYYNQGYYPSRDNILSPAQNREKQIAVPVFRMLGSDPIYQYDCGLDLDTGAAAAQPVVTLEPVYKLMGGGSQSWTDWYFRENFSGNCLSFGYTQAGQENSFGWPAMADGLTYQYERLEQLQKEGKLEVERLGDTGRWFKEAYGVTPPSVVAALSDPLDTGKRSIWYSSRYYRINLYVEGSRFWIRDMHLFREDYRERYFDRLCTDSQLFYDNLPVMDGNRWSGHSVRAGLYPMLQTAEGLQPLTFRNVCYTERAGEAFVTFYRTACGDVTIQLLEDRLRISLASAEQGEGQAESGCRMIWVPRYNSDAEYLPRRVSLDGRQLTLEYNGYPYGLRLTEGTFGDDLSIYPGEAGVEVYLKDGGC